MNVYDFDNTIFQGDSTLVFYCFCLKKHPSLLGCLPNQVMGAILYFLDRINKTSFKERFFFI